MSEALIASQTVRLVRRENPPIGFVLFGSANGDGTDYEQYLIHENTDRSLGSPSVVTVTLEPGDKLNPS